MRMATARNAELSPEAGKRGTAVQTTNRITGNARWWALGAVLLTMFFSSLDQTVVSTAMPVIVGDLKGFAIYAWVFTAYMMASAVTVPIYGKLSDTYGRKPFYIFGLAVFMVGSALSGQSHSMLDLVLFRALQGIGAGAMLSMPRATIGDIFNPRERGRWMGVTSMTFGLASIIGPFLGGWITDAWGWRWVFYINLPVAAAALVAIAVTLPRVRVERRVHVDWQGSLLLIAGLLPMLLAFTWAGSSYPWGSPVILGLFAVTLVALALFVWVEARAEEPIIPTHFFSVRMFTTTSALGLLISVGMFGTLMFLPIYIQGVLGMSAESSGIVMTPMMVSVIAGSLIAGFIMTRTATYKSSAVVAAALMTAGLALLTTLGTGATWQIVVRDLLVMGIGMGALMPILSIAVQNAFPYRHMGVVTATQQFVSSLAGVIAAPILGTVLANAFAARLGPAMPHAVRTAVATLPPAEQSLLLNPQNLINAQAQAAIASKFASFGAEGRILYQQFIDAVRTSLAGGMQRLFVIALIFGLVAFLVTFLLPAVRLKQDEFFEPEGDRPAAN